MSDPIRIVIVGAGYTGVWAYKHMAKRLRGMMRRGEVQVTVIAPKSYHSFHGFTAEALCGIISIANRQSPLRLVFSDVKVLRAHVDRVNLRDNPVIPPLVVREKLQEI